MHGVAILPHPVYLPLKTDRYNALVSYFTTVHVQSKKVTLQHPYTTNHIDIKRRLYMPTYYGRGDHRFKIKLRQQQTDVGKFSFLNRTIVDWNQLPAAVFEGSPMNLCKFKRI
jgi:hypothetical protein